MGHYWHCCRVRTVDKDSAEGAVNAYLDDKTERQEVDYGHIMAITDENGIVSIEDRDFIDHGDMFTLEDLRKHIQDGLPDLQLGLDKLKELVSKLTVDNIKDEVPTLNNMIFDIAHGVTEQKRKDFDVFKDTAYQGNLLEYGITDLNEEGYAYNDEKSGEELHTFFVWTNCHM